MKSYTKTYLDFFGYSVADFVPCEICGKKSVDIHHIEVRNKGPLNDINNLMALCRSCHVEFGDKKQHKEYLKLRHLNFMNQNGIKK